MFISILTEAERGCEVKQNLQLFNKENKTPY